VCLLDIVKSWSWSVAVVHPLRNLRVAVMHVQVGQALAQVVHRLHGEGVGRLGAHLADNAHFSFVETTNQLLLALQVHSVVACRCGLRYQIFKLVLVFI